MQLIKMNLLLKLKHWQLFLLLVGTPIVFESISIATIFNSRNPTIIALIFPVTMIMTMTVYFGWFYAIGTTLHKKLPETVKMNLTRFKIFFLIPALYILVICYFLYVAFGYQTNGEPINIELAGLIVPIHLFSMFCIFYCLYFNAKSLKAVEWQKPVTFGDFAGEFFLIWFFPIGVWIIQPRLNKLMQSEELIERSTI